MDVATLYLDSLARLIGLAALVLPGLMLLYAAQSFHFLSAQLLYGRRAVLVTGWIGVPVHELAHALVALLFAHRVDEVAFFRPDPDAPTLGYVRHRWHPGSLYQSVGQLFIGLAPLGVGLAVLYGLVVGLVPGAADVQVLVARQSAHLAASPSIVEATLLAVEGGMEALVALLAPSHWLAPRFWLFLALALPVALHMGPSPADLMGAADGLVLVGALVPLYEAVAASWLPSLPSALGAMNAAFVWLAALLPLALALAGLAVVPLLLLWQREGSVPAATLVGRWW